MQKIFTKIRNSINERENENELLDEIDDIFNKKFIDENLMKEGEKLPNKIKLTFERVKSMNIELNDNNLNRYINDCIIIENDIEKINLINEQIDKLIQNDTSKIKFYPEENEKNDIYEKMKSFGKINIFNNNYYRFKECPPEISDIGKYIVSGELKNIITKSGIGGDFAGTICEHALDKNVEIHRWKIKILKTKEREINIGVASDDFNQASPHWNKGYFLYIKQSSLYSMNYSGKNINLKKSKMKL